jgi:hypothetical protein
MENSVNKTPHHESWNKGKLIGAKSAAETQRYLGDSYSPRVGPPNPRYDFVQPGHRQ